MLGGCLQLTGVQGFEKGACEGPCPDGGADSPANDGVTDAGGCPAGLVHVPGGSYTPTSRPTGGSVRVDGLCVDATEVTESAYRACVSAGTCTAPTSSPYCNYGRPGRDNDPINCVDVTQSKTYCATRGARLPTEDEGEWVARGGALGFAYPWGNFDPAAKDDPELLCWQGKTKRDDETVWPARPMGTCPVKSFAGGARDGIFDLSGNVWEWTSTAEGTAFVFRGGSFFDPATDLGTFKVSARKVAASAPYGGVGFRCVRAE